MGNDSLAFEDRLKSNSQRAYALHTGPQPSADTHFWIYCNNPTPKEGSSNCTADLYAFVWTEEGSVERNHYMAACPMYFDADKTPTMATALDTVRTGAKSLTNIDSYTNNKGSVILHETSHWNYTVGRPEIVDYIPPDEDNKIYGAQQVTQSAQTNNVAGNSQVAEAYELESAAILAMELFGLDGPPVYVPEGKRKRQNGADDENEDTVGPPPGFNAPSDPNTPGIDATILEWDPAGAPDELQANGKSPLSLRYKLKSNSFKSLGITTTLKARTNNCASSPRMVPRLRLHGHYPPRRLHPQAREIQIHQQLHHTYSQANPCQLAEQRR